LHHELVIGATTIHLAIVEIFNRRQEQSKKQVSDVVGWKQKGASYNRRETGNKPTLSVLRCT
jgi:hypothetical protein